MAEVKHTKEFVAITLPMEVWLSVSVALVDYLRFGPGELDAEYIPDEHLERANAAIDKNTKRVEAYFDRKTRQEEA